MSNWDENDHPRDGDGQFTDKPDWAEKLTAAATARPDKLKLQDRISLDPGERLDGSGKFDGDQGTVRYAAVEGHDRSIRLGIGSAGYGSKANGRESGEPEWIGGDGFDLEEAAEQREALKAERQRLEDEWEDATPDRREQIDARIEEIEEEGTGQAYETGGSVELPAEDARRFLAELGAALETSQRIHEQISAIWDDTEDLQYMQGKLRGMQRKWTAEEEALWDETVVEIEKNEKLLADLIDPYRLKPGDDYMVFGRGTHDSGEWGELHWFVELDDPGIGVAVRLSARPVDPEEAERGGVYTVYAAFDDENYATFDPAEAARLLKQLGQLVG
jgi:hypothetical protein